MDGFIHYGTQILTFHLAPWQRIDALKSFFYPSLNYAMRTDQFGKDGWKRLDDSLGSLIKKTLSLPDRASNNFIYGTRKMGSLAFRLGPRIPTLRESIRISNCWCLLIQMLRFMLGMTWSCAPATGSPTLPVWMTLKTFFPTFGMVAHPITTPLSGLVTFLAG